MMSGTPTTGVSGLMAGGGIDAIDARIAQIESMIRSVEGARKPSASVPTPGPNGASTAFGTQLRRSAAMGGFPGMAQPPAGSLSERAKALQPLIQQYSAQHGVDPALIGAIVKQESGFNPNAVSAAGACGLMQLMPATAKSLGVKNAFDPAENIEAGVRYFKGKLAEFHGNIPLALAAYNAGSGAVSRHGGVPPYRETQHYVRNILGAYLRQKSHAEALS